MIQAENLTGKCSCCGATPKDPARLPRGWKRHQAQNYCDKCWVKRFTLRAISIPIVRPLGDGVGWEQLKKSLSEAWADSTACANWMSGEYYARDVRRAGGESKLPKMPEVYLYPEATKRFPSMPTQAVSGMCQVVGRKYRSKRYDIVWTSAATNSNHRYPYPAAFPAQAWTPSFETAGSEGGDKIPCVSLPIRRGERYLLQLRGGRDFARQLRDFKDLVSGVGVRGEIALYRQRVGGNENRNGVTGRDSGNQRAAFRVMCKMVGWFPRRQDASASGVLRVRTDVDAMLVALNEKDERMWWLNGDQVRRWAAEHRRSLNRWAEDSKHEHRPDVPLQSRRERACDKHHNRTSSFIKMAVAQLCGLAQRRRIAEIRYDDSERRYLGEFSWAALETALHTKSVSLGINYVHASGDVVKGDEGASRDHTSTELGGV